jgi:2-dehydro-3-deoxyphosphogluconate aldolase/(4S)-4-hydroxy-2-oxoglutarate aldolase
MSAATQRTLAHIEQAGVIPVLRTQSEQAARELITGLLDAGRPIIEITLTTPGAMTLIAKLAGRTDVVVGAGTVLTNEQAVRAVEAGAQFLISAVNPDFFLPVARELDVLGIPGASTPNELWSAWASGAPMVKIFPVIRLGGASYIKDLRGPFPDIPLMSSGGVTTCDVIALRAAGSNAVGINASALVA